MNGDGLLALLQTIVMRAPSLLVGAVAIAVLASAAPARSTPELDLCSSLANGYEARVERLMREALSAEIAPFVIRYALPIHTETGIGITRDASGFRLVRAAFDRSLWYESWIDEVQDFDRVEPRVAILSIPVSDGLADELVELLEGLEPASESERSDIIVLDGVSMDLFQTSGRCLTLAPRTGDSAATKLTQLIWFLEDEMSAWRALRKNVFEAEVLSMIRDIRAPQ